MGTSFRAKMLRFFLPYHDYEARPDPYDANQVLRRPGSCLFDEMIVWPIGDEYRILSDGSLLYLEVETDGTWIQAERYDYGYWEDEYLRAPSWVPLRCARDWQPKMHAIGRLLTRQPHSGKQVLFNSLSAPPRAETISA